MYSKTIASEGVDVFYKGDIGSRIATQICKRMAVLSPGKTSPITTWFAHPNPEGSYRGLRLATNRPVDRAFKCLRH